MDKLDIRRAEELEAQYDPELEFREINRYAKFVVSALLLAMSLYHVYIAGFGMPTTHWLTGIHTAFVIGLSFVVYGISRAKHEGRSQESWWNPGGVPLYDWVLAALAAAAALYVPWTLDDLTFRVGNPNTADLVFGTILTVLVLEASRRAMGWSLTIIGLLSLVYAVYGNWFPGILGHPGSTWGGVISNIFLLDQGIFGTPIFVMASIVFHFVLFGVIAMRMGLGQLFIDIGYCIAGRYAGGPAKVSVISSAMMGTISGSSIANTVTIGSLTIPAMKRIGYKPHFAGGVEAAASTGGQITPPVMGAAAFVMAEFLAIPYVDICIAAAVPAFMHYVGVFTMVHLEAKKTGLLGLPEDELPKLRTVLREGALPFIPLIVLVYFIFEGYTPYMAAFWGIVTSLAVGLVNPRNRMTPMGIVLALVDGAKYAIAVGAGAAAVGVFIGVLNLSGLGFKLSYVVTQAAITTSEDLMWLFSFLPFEVVTQQGLSLFITLVFIALACVAMGTGLPTTALYIILAAIAAPAVVQMGVPPLAAHLFVLYYGVLADLTPPVCVAAFAAAGIAGADPWKTGNSAFRMGNAKILVPFVFVYSPAMLIVLDQYFTWTEFLFTTISCFIGIVFLGSALIGYMFANMPMWMRIILGIASVCMVSPAVTPTFVGAAVAVLMLGLNWLQSRRAPRAVPAG